MSLPRWEPEPRWNPSFSRFRWCGLWSCWVERAILGAFPWGAQCAFGHGLRAYQIRLKKTEPLWTITPPIEGD